MIINYSNALEPTSPLGRIDPVSAIVISTIREIDNSRFGVSQHRCDSLRSSESLLIGWVVGSTIAEPRELAHIANWETVSVPVQRLLHNTTDVIWESIIRNTLDSHNANS
jgi:hypothetical protein